MHYFICLFLPWIKILNSFIFKKFREGGMWMRVLHVFFHSSASSKRHQIPSFTGCYVLFVVFASRVKSSFLDSVSFTTKNTGCSCLQILDVCYQNDVSVCLASRMSGVLGILNSCFNYWSETIMPKKSSLNFHFLMFFCSRCFFMGCYIVKILLSKTQTKKTWCVINLNY